MVPGGGGGAGRRERGWWALFAIAGTGGERSTERKKRINYLAWRRPENSCEVASCLRGVTAETSPRLAAW
eukprot:scaffold105393_cov60-Phaeocystis_antarctica.AAC.3